jgi:nucleoside-diphosphate-sugar epimerase
MCFTWQPISYLRELTMTKFALFGASGAIGRSVAAALRAQNTPYRVVGRSRASLEQAFGSDPLAEIITWNPDDPESVRIAARGVDTIIYVVGVNYWEFSLHPQLMQKTLDGAIAENVKHIVLCGTVYSYGRPQTEFVSEDHPRSPHTFKGKMRKAQEDILLAAHANGKIKATVLRLPDFYGPGADKSLLDGVFKAAQNDKTAQMIGPIDTPHEFIFVPDAGPALVALAKEENAYGKVWHFAGAGITTQRKMAEKIFETLNKKPRLMIAPPWMVRVIGWFDKFIRELVEMSYLQTTPVLMDDSALRNLLPNLHKTSYEEGIKKTLAAGG